MRFSSNYKIRFDTAKTEISYLFEPDCLYKYVIDTSKPIKESLFELSSIIEYEQSGLNNVVADNLTLSSFRKKFASVENWNKIRETDKN